MRIPNHIGIIPDGNRRWATRAGLAKKDGYVHGLTPGLDLLRLAREAGVREITYYGFTTDNRNSSVFPEELRPYTVRTDLNGGGMRVNFLVNYGWEWDLAELNAPGSNRRQICNALRSHDISRVDLVIRWGGMRRLSGFLPVQSVYADFFVVDRLWPDFQPDDFFQALQWYQAQDVTLGG